MTYPSMLCASLGMVQDSKIPLEPTGSPSRITGGPGTKEKDVCVKTSNQMSGSSVQLCKQLLCAN